MAKAEMICPFSGKHCEECASYRGRHYFLCFCETYRGHLEGATNRKPKANSNGKFEMPTITVCHDIFDAPQKDIR